MAKWHNFIHVLSIHLRSMHVRLRSLLLAAQSRSRRSNQEFVSLIAVDSPRITTFDRSYLKCTCAFKLTNNLYIPIITD